MLKIEHKNQRGHHQYQPWRGTSALWAVEWQVHSSGECKNEYIFGAQFVENGALVLVCFLSDDPGKCSPQPGRDAKGAALALFTARLHRPDITTHKAVLQAIIYQLDKAIERWPPNILS